jgi:hypothetical protein
MRVGCRYIGLPHDPHNWYHDDVQVIAVAIKH